jgi:Bacterial membrane protein YfhO
VSYLADGAYKTGGSPSKPQRIVQFSSPGTILVEDSLPDQDRIGSWPRELLVLERPEPASKDVTIERYAFNEVAVRTHGEVPSFLVFSTIYDKNWHCVVDGKPTDVYVANAAFCAVAVPAGSHEVVFTFSPPWLRPALALYVLALAAVVAWAVSSGSRSAWRRASGP